MESKRCVETNGIGQARTRMATNRLQNRLSNSNRNLVF